MLSEASVWSRSEESRLCNLVDVRIEQQVMLP